MLFGLIVFGLRLGMLSSRFALQAWWLTLFKFDTSVQVHHMRICIQICMHKQMHICIHTHILDIHAYMHTCI